jgi:uncharacterized protein YpiB (UPF0302 family)
MFTEDEYSGIKGYTSLLARRHKLKKVVFVDKVRFSYLFLTISEKFLTHQLFGFYNFYDKENLWLSLHKIFHLIDMCTSWKFVPSLDWKYIKAN